MEKFDPERYLQMVQQYRITHSQLVPTMFVRMLKLPLATRQQYDTYSMKSCRSCSYAVPNSDKRTAEEANELPTGETGTVYFANGAHFEYHNDPEKTRSATNQLGWTTLGDVGHVDQEGYRYLTDRKAYTIISGGVNIYPQETEDLLVTHPKVADVAFFGIQNEEFGEEVKAVVQPAKMSEAGADLEQELIAFCKEHLSSIKCPQSIDFDAELPRHPTGKLYKRLLKDRY